MSLIRVRADDVLGDGDAVFGQAFSVEGAWRVVVALLFVRGTVTLHGTLVVIWVSRSGKGWLNGHHRLLALSEPPIGGESNGPI